MQDTAGLTGLQLSILHVLWERGEASTHDVWKNVMHARPLALTTVATLLSRLERKHVLAHRRCGRQYLYHATVTRAEVQRLKVRELTESLFDGDTTALVSHLVHANEVDTGDLDRIRALIEEAEIAESTGGD